MRRGANNNGAPVVVDGEVHVERVEKFEVVGNGVGVPPLTTAVAIVLPPRGKAGCGPPATTAASGKAAVPDVNELAKEFIRRNRAAFQGGTVDDQYQNNKIV